MKRTLTIALATACAAVVFGGLVYAVLLAAQLAQPAAQTVEGLTARRLWATTAVLLGVIGVMAGARRAANIAVAAGLVAAVNGGLNAALANGGPGSGNGVVGGAAALVLGLGGVALGLRALAGPRRATVTARELRAR